MGSLDIFLTPRCDEEIHHYIKCINETFNKILDNDPLLKECADEFTIENIQLRVPALSKYDAEFIQNEMTAGRLFPEIKEPITRQGITSRLLLIDYPIPTLKSLFKNLRFLEPAIGMIRALIPRIRKGTLREALHFRFEGTADESLEVQVSEHSYRTFTVNRELSFEFAVRQLFLCAIRYAARPPKQREGSYSIFRLAGLAQKLGFSSDEIDSLMKSDVYKRMVLDLLYRILPTNTPVEIEARAQPLARVCRELVDALRTPAEETSAPWGTVPGLGEPISQRCGPEAWEPFNDDSGGKSDDLHHIFLPQMHTPLADLRRGGEGVSPFFVKRSIYLAFFGALPGNESSPTITAHTVQMNTGQNTVQPLQELVAFGRNFAESDPGPGEGSQGSAANQVAIVEKVMFVRDGAVISEVPYEKQSVQFQAREYANQGMKLFTREGAFFLWKDSFDILEKVKARTVFLETIVGPVNGKRRYGHDLPDRLEPATKEAFDWSMDGEIQEEEL